MTAVSGVGYHHEDVEIGDVIGPVERVVTGEQVSQFLQIRRPRGGDNRFTDAHAARRDGLPGPMVPGALTMAALSRLITDWSPTVRLRRLDVVFRQVVMHNRRLRLRGVVTDKSVVDEEALIECDLLVENEEGSVLTTGRATFSLPTRARG